MALPAKQKQFVSAYQCDITETRRMTEDRRLVTVYGLSLHHRLPSLARCEGESCRIDDISDDRSKVLRLKELIDEEGLYPVHLKDVVEDFLS